MHWNRRRTLFASVVAMTLTIATAAPVAWGAFTTTRLAAGAVSTTTLAAPTGLASSVTGSGPSATVALTWTATTSSRATGTRVFRATVSGGPYAQVVQISGLGTTGYTDTPSGGGTYYYVVTSYYTGNGANWSSVNGNQTTAVVPYTAYVGNYLANTVTRINTTTNLVAGSLAQSGPTTLAITPDGKTAYIANYNAGTITPINLATKTAGTAINVGTQPWAIAITPDGKTASRTTDRPTSPRSCSQPGRRGRP